MVILYPNHPTSWLTSEKINDSMSIELVHSHVSLTPVLSILKFCVVYVQRLEIVEQRPYHMLVELNIPSKQFLVHKDWEAIFLSQEFAYLVLLFW